MDILKSLWLLIVAILIMIGHALPVAVLILFVTIALAAPLIREFRKASDLDERQIQIGHFSSHIAYFVFSALLIMVLIKQKISTEPLTVYWYVQLFVPMSIKLIICAVQSYGPVHGGFRGIFCLFFRGIIHSKLVDERQHDIGNFSSHIAFYLYTALTLFFIILNFSHIQEKSSSLWFMLLLVPILVKLFVSLFMSYGPGIGARFIGYTISGFWLLYILLSHGLALGSLIEAGPFLLLLSITFFSKRYPLLGGIAFFFLGIASIYFFDAWLKKGLYHVILMYSFIPFPILLSAVAFLYKFKTGNNED